MSFRAIRRWLTAQAMFAGRRAAPLLPLPLISATQKTLSRLGPHAPVIGQVVASNMRAAGVYSDDALRAYFEQVAGHLANALRIFRLAPSPAAVDRLARDQIDLDDSLGVLKETARAGRGVILATAHLVNFVLWPARLKEEVPLHVLLRWSDNKGRMQLKRDWYEACGLHVVVEQPGRSLAACVEAVRKGAVLLITPDVAQKPDEGVRVSLFGRGVYLPTGAPGIALVAEAPIIPLFARLENGRQVLYAEQSYRVERASKTREDRNAVMQEALQTWADHFEAFVRRSPAAWFLWGDSRWTRVFGGDPKYTGDEGPRGQGTEGPRAGRGSLRERDPSLGPTTL